jgi:hypothetical protein
MADDDLPPVESGEPGSTASGVKKKSNGFSINVGGRFMTLDLLSKNRLSLFKIDPRGTLDEIASKSLSEVSKEYIKKDVKKWDDKATDVREFAWEYIRSKGLAAQISKVTESLNKSALDDTSRWLLSSPGVYEHLLMKALIDEEVDAKTEIDGLRRSIMLYVKDEPRRMLYTDAVSRILAFGKIEMDKDDVERLIEAVDAANIPLRAGALQPGVMKIFEDQRKEGNLPEYVDIFAGRKEIDLARLTPAIRAAMVKYLGSLGVKFTKTGVENGKYDEYFAVAYNQAVRSSKGGNDPLTLKYADSVADWDFSVDEFDTVEEQGIVKENILAAGALYYIHELGEHLGIFKLADSLVLRWAAGAIDLAEGDAASKLYRYWKLREERSSEEERGLLYKRVLNIGDTKVLSKMVVNEEFPDLWARLMQEVTEYIGKTEQKDTGGEQVSKASMYEATRNLQYNLTSHMTGMAHMLVREMYSNLREALEILGHPEIVDFFGGGRRKNLWTVIEKLSKEEFSVLPNISALRTMAVEGNRVFQWIGKFDGPGAVAEQDLQSFLSSSEAWILAQATVERTGKDEEEEEEDEDETEEDIEKEVETDSDEDSEEFE